MILIVGAGVSGLTVARYLQRHELPFLIFDQAPKSRFQGYGVTIRSKAVSALLELLEIDEYALQRAVSVDRCHGLLRPSIRDAETGETYSQGAEYRYTKHSGDFRGNRERLRRTIQGDIEILFDHKLRDVRRTQEGVEVTFENGKTYHVDLLVAADGVHSVARNIFARKKRPTDFPCIVMTGTFELTPCEFDRSMRDVMQGSVAQVGVIDEELLAVTIYDIAENGNIMISWVRSRPARSQDDPLFVPYWMKRDLTVIHPKFWEEIENLPKMIEPFEYIFHGRDIHSDRIVQQILVNHLMSIETLESIWQKQKVVFVGDSARTWSHHAGSAASTAVVDGVTLAETLLSQKSVEEWYRRRIPVWEHEIELNTKDFETLHLARAQWQARSAKEKKQNVTSSAPTREDLKMSERVITASTTPEFISAKQAWSPARA